MKIVIDSAIPFIKGVFEPYASVQYIAGDSFTPHAIEGADGLIIRTRTRCNNSLLEGCSVRHIATATIGTDHIDSHFCSEQGITTSSAAGCNARAVLQWFGAVMAHLSRTQGWEPSSKKLGVVGVGNVGGLVAAYGAAWGFEVICCDPPRMEAEGGDFVSLEELLEAADIVTLHTPLNSSTRHMIGAQSLAKAGRDTIIINSSRGEVVDTEALLKASNPFVMDVWEREPAINSEALRRVLLATPHIAGYSLQGKANATTMAVRGVAKALGLPLEGWRSDAPQSTPRPISWNDLLQSIDSKFDIAAQSNHLKAHVEEFEKLRNEYDYRIEYF
ncbi:MAG: 4-phosphoerythronate dehydrogenase [Rikenellaceae bacterium]